MALITPYVGRSWRDTIGDENANDENDGCMSFIFQALSIALPAALLRLQGRSHFFRSSFFQRFSNLSGGKASLSRTNADLRTGGREQCWVKRQPMREQLPNARSFVELSSGKCHYGVDGPATGRTLVMIHGATVPLWQFDRLVPLINLQGIRTIRLDLFGHGYSDRPDVVHNSTLFTRQVDELLDCLGVADEVDLLGHSLGSAIAARLMLADPCRFGSLVMTAPVLNYLDSNPAARLLHVPLLGEWLMDKYVLPMLVRRRTHRYSNIQDGRFVQMFRDQLSVPGFGRSLLSLVRSDALGDQRTCYAALNKLANPILIMGAAGDRIARPAHINILRGLLPKAEYYEIDNAEHALILSHPEQVALHVGRFLSRQAIR